MRLRLLLVAFVVSAVFAVDVRDTVVDVGLADYSLGTRSPFARNPWDLAYFAARNRVFIGQGNSDNDGSPSGNGGPIRMVSFVPGATDGAFLLEGPENLATFPEEQCDRFLIYNGSLFWGGHDPRISWSYRTTYRSDPPGSPGAVWKFFNSTCPGVSSWGVHVYDIFPFKGKLYSVGYDYGFSTDMGETWTMIFPGGARKNCFFTVNDQLYAAGWGWYLTLYQLDTTNGTEYKRYDTMPDYEDRYVLMPMLHVTGRQRTNHYLKIERPVSLPSGGTIYLGGLASSDHQALTVDVFYVRALAKENVDIVRTTPAGEERAWDLLLRGTTVYLLTSRTVITAGAVEQYVASVWSCDENDYTQWTLVFSCSGLPTFARSFEEVNGDFYLGLGTDDGNGGSFVSPTTAWLPIPEELYTSIKPDSGRILWVKRSAFASNQQNTAPSVVAAEHDDGAVAASNSVWTAAEEISVPFNAVVNVSGASAAVAGACWPTETSSRTRSLWYSIVGTDRLLRVYTCDSTYKENTRLSIYTAENGALMCLAHNNDNTMCGTNSQQSSIMWFAEFNKTYYIQLSSGSVVPGDSFVARLRVGTQTAATCTGLPAITTSSPSNGNSLPNSTYTRPFSSCSRRQSLPAGEWSRRPVSWFTVAGTGRRLRIAVSNSNSWIPAIEIRRSCAGSATEDDCVAFTDEYTPMPVEWDSESGVMYWVAVYASVMSTTSADFSVTLTSSTAAKNGRCDTASFLNLTAVTSHSLTADTSKAPAQVLCDSCNVFSRDADAFGGSQSLWYEMPGDGKLWTATTCPTEAGASNWNAMVEVYDGCPSAGATATCVNGWQQTAVTACGFLNNAVWYARLGRTYFLRFTSAFSKAAGSATATLAAADFVRCSVAEPVSNNHAAGNMSAVSLYQKAAWNEWKAMQVAWHRWTASEAGTATIQVKAQRAVWVEVFSSCDADGISSSLLASEFAASNETATVSWESKAGESFWIATASLQSSTMPSTFDLWISFAALPKSDDNVSAAPGNQVGGAFVLLALLATILKEM